MPALSPRKKTILIAAVLAAALAGGSYYLLTAGTERTDDAAIEAPIVPVSPQISGYVQAVNVVDNQQVKTGDVLVAIDPADYRIRVDQAQAQLEAAQAKLEAAQSGVASTRITAPSDTESARAEVESARASLSKAQSDLARYQAMSDLARSKKQLDDAVVAEKEARANLAAAQAKLRSAETAPKTVAAAEAGVRELESAVKNAEGQLEDAQRQLGYTQLTAPFDGRITRKNVEPGAFVQPGQSLMALVSDDYWVIANFKETQLTHMRPGQAVDIRIDAYPKRSYRGKVDSIQSGTGARFSAFPPENATGNFVKVVQRVPVKIVFEERPDESVHIGPGMSVVPTVHVQ